MEAIFAPSVLVAQGYVLTAADRAELVARANLVREITGSTAKTNINVPVCDVYTHAKIGYLTYHF